MFLNSAIGRLYRDYDDKFVHDHLKILNLHKDNQFILDRVVQRAKDFYSNLELITEVLDEELI